MPTTPHRDGLPRTDIQRLAGILAAVRIVEAEALMRFSRVPESEEMANLIDDAMHASLQHMWDNRLAVPKPCPGGYILHTGCMCNPSSIEAWLRRVKEELPPL